MEGRTKVRDITGIIIHHSLTKDSGTVSWGAIERYHRQVLGYRDISYNFGLEVITTALGELAYYAMVGRDININAAGEPKKGSNKWGVHICIVGNFDLQPPPEEMLKMLRYRLVRPLMDQYNILPNRVLGHTELDRPDKSCPGSKFNMPAFRRSLA